VCAKTFRERIEAGEIVGRQNLALDDGEADFDLIQPTGMNRGVDQDQPRVKAPESLDGSGASMSGAIVDNPKNATRLIVGRPRHNLFDQTIKQEAAQCLLQVNGVGPVTTLTYVLTIEDKDRFEQSRDVPVIWAVVHR